MRVSERRKSLSTLNSPWRHFHHRSKRRVDFATLSTQAISAVVHLIDEHHVESFKSIS